MVDGLAGLGSRSQGWHATPTAIYGAFTALRTRRIMFDARLLGAILAGMPCSTSQAGQLGCDRMAYDKIRTGSRKPTACRISAPNRRRADCAATSCARPASASRISCSKSLDQRSRRGRKDRSDRVPPRSTPPTQRLIDILNATAKAAGWEPRPSPHAKAHARAGNDRVTGRGVCIMRRTNAYWVGIAEVAVTPATGAVTVTNSPSASTAARSSTLGNSIAA